MDKDIVFEVKVKYVTNKYGTVQVGKIIQVKLQDNNILIQQGGDPNRSSNGWFINYQMKVPFY